jgi:hypothetical protein
MTQETQTYNLLVRFPADMKDAMRSGADADVRSVNGLIVTAVRRYLESVQAGKVSHFATSAGSAERTPLAERAGSEVGATRD